MAFITIRDTVCTEAVYYVLYRGQYLPVHGGNRRRKGRYAEKVSRKRYFHSRSWSRSLVASVRGLISPLRLRKIFQICSIIMERERYISWLAVMTEGQLEGCHFWSNTPAATWLVADRMAKFHPIFWMPEASNGVCLIQPSTRWHMGMTSYATLESFQIRLFWAPSHY